MGALTDEQKHFLAWQRIAASEMFDASGMSPAEFDAAMEKEKKLFAFGIDPCPYGHTLKTRWNHCIQCDTKRIAIVKRLYEEAYVYIAGSKIARVLKIGFSVAPRKRVTRLNYLSHGGISDWKILYRAWFQNAGTVEIAAQNHLSSFATRRKGRKEIFACTYVEARNALRSASPVPGTKEWEFYSAKYLYRFSEYWNR